MALLPPDAIYAEVLAALACYDWESAVEKLEVIFCLAYEKNQSELAGLVAEEVREAYETMGLALRGDSLESLIAIQEGRLDLWTTISHW